MKIAKINGTKVVEIVELKTFSNTSFPKSGPDADWLSANSCAATATLNRASRDYRLANCDWVVTKAIEANSSVPTAWGAYRTALRDITTHDNWPNINKGDWPTEPS